MTSIAEADGYTLSRRPAGKATEYTLTYLVDGLEHQDHFDRVDIDGREVLEIREIPRWGDAEVGNLDPGILDTELGPVLRWIANGGSP